MNNENKNILVEEEEIILASAQHIHPSIFQMKRRRRL